MRLRFKKLAESFSSRLTVSLISFGFKHGTPLDVDTLLDARFLPNPHYDPVLRPLTGHDEPVREAVLGHDDAQRRSEEHTSELQSRQYLVCRLLLEKKKKTNRAGRWSSTISDVVSITLRRSAPKIV